MRKIKEQENQMSKPKGKEHENRLRNKKQKKGGKILEKRRIREKNQDKLKKNEEK